MHTPSRVPRAWDVWAHLVSQLLQQNTHPTPSLLAGQIPVIPTSSRWDTLPFPPTSIRASAGSWQEADPIMTAHIALLVTPAPSYFGFAGGFFRPAEKEPEDFLEP